MKKYNPIILALTILVFFTILLILGLKIANPTENTLDIDNSSSSSELLMPVADNMDSIPQEIDIQVKSIDDLAKNELNSKVFVKQVKVWDNLITGTNQRGTNFSTQVLGSLGVKFEDSKTYLKGKFSNLPDPVSGDYYEGWLVRKSPFAFISTGRLSKATDGTYENYYISGNDYSDYNFYVLTLESVNGDETPEIHVVEGDIQ